uniref:diguanylate cyclase n=1 Tax=Desulfovibrio sp. U5L TaxID=596152 RepID=I2Q7G2_9BACT
MKHLDFQTAVVIYVGSNLCIAALLAVAFSDSRARGVRLWLAGLAAQIVGVPLFALRGVFADSLTIVLANGLFALSWSCFFASYDVFFGNRRSGWIYAAPVLLSVAVAVGLLGDVKPRAVLLAALYAGQTWSIAALILERSREFRRRVILMLAAGYALAGLSFLVRAVSVLFSSQATPDPFAARPAQDVTMLLFIPSLAACTLGFVLLHRERIEREARRLAETDALTGLRNRRRFAAALDRALGEAAAYGTWTSLALLDIDGFKAVNHRHGHAVGDAALAALAGLFGPELRGGDLAARMDGDEFVLLLTRTSPERAARVAERLRQAVAGHDWGGVGLDAPLSVTVGLASHRGGPDCAAAFLRRADRTLLAAKGLFPGTVLHADTLFEPPGPCNA